MLPKYTKAGAMYEVTNEMLDWRQLGILLTFCHENVHIDQYHKLKPAQLESSSDPYIRDLLKGNA